MGRGQTCLGADRVDRAVCGGEAAAPRDELALQAGQARAAPLHLQQPHSLLKALRCLLQHGSSMLHPARRAAASVLIMGPVPEEASQFLAATAALWVHASRRLSWTGCELRCVRDRLALLSSGRRSDRDCHQHGGACSGQRLRLHDGDLPR